MTRFLILVAWLAALPAARGDTTLGALTFHSGDLALAGTVYEPEGAGPFPCIVLVHGSGPGERQRLREQADALAGMGLAVLAWDKRGSGQSEGNWITSSLDDLALDAAAALDAVKALPLTDPDRCGYWGISQGGWVVPLAAAISRPAFSIVVSGGGLTPREVELAAYRDKVRNVDQSERARKDSETLLTTYFGYLAGNVAFEALTDCFERYRETGWFQALGIEHVIPGEANRGNWEWVATFDPSDSIAALRSPVLVILGDQDPLTPVGPTERAWKRSLRSADSHSRVVVIPGAGHGIRTGGHFGPFMDGFFDLQNDWLVSLGILD